MPIPWLDSIVLKALWTRRFGATVVAALIVGGGVAGALTSRSVYRAEGKLLVRLGRENVTLDPTTNLGQGQITAVPTVRDGEMYTVVETLRSTQLFDRLVEEIGAEPILADQSASWLPWRVAESPEAAARRVERMIGVEPLRKSNLIAVACTAHDPEFAARIVAKYVELCMAHHRSLYRNPGAVDFFDQQSKLIAVKLRATEDRIVEVKSRVGVTSIAEDQRLLQARAAALEEDVQKTEQSIAAGRAEITAIRKQMTALPATVVLEQSTGHPQSATDAMREKLYALEMEEKGLQAELTDEHFRLRQVREKLADTRRIFEQQQAHRTHTTEGPNRAYEQVRGALLARESEVAALEERRRVTEPQLVAVRRRLEDLNHAELQLAGLERERDLQQADYLKYARSLEQVRIDQALAEEHISNLSLAQPPRVDRAPVGPNRPLLLILAGIAAVTAAVGYALAAEGLLGSDAGRSASASEAAPPEIIDVDGPAEAAAEEPPPPSDHQDPTPSEPEPEVEEPAPPVRRAVGAPVGGPRYLPLSGMNDPLPPPAATF